MAARAMSGPTVVAGATLEGRPMIDQVSLLVKVCA
jgi:hypothetical protein